MALKKGDWVVYDDGKVAQALSDMSDLLFDSYYPTKEVAEIRGAVLIADRLNRQPTTILTSKMMVDQAMQILNDEIAMTYRENKNGL